MATATATEKKIKVGSLFRDFLVRKDDINVEKRTVALSFSSETEEVVRYFGAEVLDHSPGACDLSRLKRAGALLIDHDPRNQVGVIEEVTIGADRKGRAVVRFGRSAKAEEIFQDVVDGIRKNVSCGYEPQEMVLERQQENGPDVYRVTRWMPFEISLVSIPADTSVGVGRSEGRQEREITVIIPERQARQAELPACHSKDMEPMMKPEDCMQGEECGNARCSAAQKAPRHTTPQEVRIMKACEVCGGEIDAAGKCNGAKHDELVQVRQKAAQLSAREMEEKRKTAIRNICKTNNLDTKYEEMFISRGYSLEQVADDIVAIFEERGKNNPNPATRIGLTASETKQFSLARAINACASKDWKDAGFELEASRAVAQKLGKSPDPMKFYVPFEVLERPIDRSAKRDLSTAAGGGNYLVETQNMGFIEYLRNRSVVMRMGARRLSGLTGNVAVPRMSATGTAYWLANETTQITESTPTIVQMSLSPKTAGAYTEISRQLLLQSVPGAEGIVSDDLAQLVATAADLACIAGAGASGEPDGIIGFSGVGSVTGTDLAYADILEFQTDVAESNVIPMRGGYVTTPAVASLCMQRQKFTSTDTPLWVGNIWDGQMAGFPAMSSNQVPSGDMIFGDWQEMVIGEWGVLEIEVNPYANFQAGIVGVRAIYTMDVGHRRPFAFSVATSIT